MVRGYPFAQSDFDWQRLRQLAGEDTDFEAELLAVFLSDAEGSLKELEKAIAHQDIQAVEEIAHTLRGAGANVGASALALTARQLEHIAHSGEITAAQTLLQEMRSHCQKIRAQSQIRR